MHTDLDKQIAGAEAYESLHVPALFSQWAPRMLDAAAVEPGDRVLDVACGTGVLAREARGRVGPEGQVVGVDLGEGMLAVARSLDASIDWRQGPAESLPVRDGEFDRVVSQFGLMFFTDRAQALREMRRALRPAGTLAVAVWESLDRSQAYPEEVDLLDRLAGPEAAAALSAPFALGDVDGLRALFESAGIDAVQVATHTGTARFPTLRSMVEADLRGWLPIMGVHLDEPLIDRILAEAETALAAYVQGSGQAVFDAPAHIVTGMRAQ